jgi:predicted O-linked N-acetylglucosamine transferase (SPINDLY family)
MNASQDLKAADAKRDQGLWQDAIQIYERINQSFPQSVSLKHNLALCYFALGRYVKSKKYAEEAITLDPKLWQSSIVLAKSLKELGDEGGALNLFTDVSQQGYDQGEALLGIADLWLNEFGDPMKAISTIQPLFEIDEFKDDARLTELMANLYDRDESAESLTERIKLFSQQSIQLDFNQVDFYFKEASKKKSLKPRVGLISSMFSVSPVYFLTYEFFKNIAKQCDLIFFNRGVKLDWATEQFKAISFSWLDLFYADPIALARQIHHEEIDVLYDLSGWMDPLALRALSLKPARQQLKWVGGQSITTGLNCFDGWIGDSWHTPPEYQYLYTEPLMNKGQDYVFYTPPPYMPKPIDKKSDTYAIFANPIKLSREFLQELKNIPGGKCFIHSKYRHQVVRDRIESIINKKEITYICPETHLEALKALNQFRSMIDTYPYSSGLTAREAESLGVNVLVLRIGKLFCERHTARYKN